ncbi:uncharacterized protein AAES06_018266 [Glossophaga mutica]
MEFVLLGFSDIPNIQWILFGIFLVIYLTILMCNSIIILITKTDPDLQTPMYFFLSNFSFLEICYVTVTIPRMLMDLVSQKGNISLLACATQMSFVLMLGGSECLLLTVMAYDRYMAICNPLHYTVVMNQKVCVQMVTASWVSGVPVVIGQTWQIFSLPFCGSNTINHFFCDLPPVLKLACGDTFVNEIVVYVVAVVFITVPFLLIVASYGKIISNILKLSSARGKAKAFSTCSSHLIVVILFYGTATITYLQPKPNQSEGIGKLISLFYTVLIPTLNPIIYTLRNKDIVVALKKLLTKSLRVQFYDMSSAYCIECSPPKVTSSSATMKHQEKPPEGNWTKPMEFVLLDFAEVPHLQWFLFGLFLIIYVMILIGNGTVFLITKLDPALQTPMYFLLGNFSFLEICYVSVILPRMLTNLWTQRRRISLVACAAQMCFFLMLGATECFLLAVMAYDRYVAICHPLHYPLVMNRKVCVLLVAGSWMGGIPIQMGQTVQIFSLPFCGSNLINHFFCDIPPVLKLACGNTAVNKTMVYIAAVLLLTVPSLWILVSYGKIILTILKLPSATSRAKAFSTCSSHLIVVTLFFGSATITYFSPKSQDLAGTNKVLSLFYTIATPLFNPMVYSLRNKDVVKALKKLLCK